MVSAYIISVQSRCQISNGMDIAAHALWSGAIYNKKRVWWAIFFGVAPDLFSFGVLWLYFFSRGEFLPFSRVHGAATPLEWSAIIPSFVYPLYSFTHSLAIWAVLFFIAWVYLRRIPWEFTAWGLHIVTDIATHAAEFFPTPFLWPLPQPFVVNSISWGVPWFMAINYGALVLVYAYLFRKARKIH